MGFKGLGLAAGAALVVSTSPTAWGQPVRLVSRAASPGPSATADRGSGGAVLSPNGRFALFSSAATNLVPGQVDTNLNYDLFIFDRTLEATTLVSHAAGSAITTGNKVSLAPCFNGLSADGRYAAFQSSATDLVAGQQDTGASADVFLFDRATGTTALVTHSVGSTTAVANGGSFGCAASGDGRYVAFASAATDLVAGAVDANADLDVFLYDRTSGLVRLVSHVPSSQTTTSATPTGFGALISADGSTVVFTSAAVDLVAGMTDNNAAEDTFAYDVATGAIRLVSASGVTPQASANASSAMFAVSASGRYVLLTSAATDLVAGQVDTNQSIDLFLADLMLGSVQLVSHAAGSPATAADSVSGDSAGMSEDGRYVAHVSHATNLVAGQQDANGLPDVFLYDRATGFNLLVSHVAGLPTRSGTPSRFDPRSVHISADGRRVSYASGASELVDGFIDGNGADFADVFVWDRSSSLNRLVSRRSVSASASGNGASIAGPLSADGRFLFFLSDASDLVAGDQNADQDAFLYGPATPLSFHTLEPCRVADTRGVDGPAVEAGATRDFVVRGRCGVPDTAESVALNLTVTEPTGPGHVTLFTPGQIAPPASTLNFGAGQTRANSATLALGRAGRASVLAGMAQGQVQVLIDVVGYFE